VTVYRLRQLEGTGWVREFVDGRPIITSWEPEAGQWADRTEAHRVARAIRRLGLIPVEVVAGDARERAEWGDPAVAVGRAGDADHDD